jgi:hypothetical protein
MFRPVERIKNIKVEFDEKRILGLTGYRKRPKEIKEPIKNLIAEEKKKLDNLLHPASIYTIIDYAETSKHPIFKDAEKAAICICTIGPELEQEIKTQMEKNDRLTESCMMVPRKSVSFRINFYKEQKISTRKNSFEGIIHD